MTADPDKAKSRLAAKRAELEALSAASAAARRPDALDQQAIGRLSRMDAMQQRAMAEAAERARRRDLTRIEMAERRLAAGDYGHCVDCDAPIADGRLAIDPMAERCVRCAGRR
ncbi:TraR/DksA C4-type zinc finger protein [Aquibium sp. A9E412]|uniref:TraR/DksA family transcriptional regulator n=1 Tax=Aquibium sp. A9E412 TaxID=2976767 RepID=UPI0025AF5ABE|nr:TraR/DksA C4-type zinc finger protein [Aquibium sp. A9E412]MDN2566731.1 TraR/DksA C4-type zinc finger protein [Aquibium sp. A9E412]